jgi:hypothetical protein
MGLHEVTHLWYSAHAYTCHIWLYIHSLSAAVCTYIYVYIYKGIYTGLPLVLVNNRVNHRQFLPSPIGSSRKTYPLPLWVYMVLRYHIDLFKHPCNQKTVHRLEKHSKCTPPPVSKESCEWWAGESFQESTHSFLSMCCIVCLAVTTRSAWWLYGMS